MSLIEELTQTGSLTADLDGNIVQTGGSLENAEDIGSTLYKMLTCIPGLTSALDGQHLFKRITISSEDSVYIATATGDKVHAVHFSS